MSKYVFLTLGSNSFNASEAQNYYVHITVTRSLSCGLLASLHNYNYCIITIIWRQNEAHDCNYIHVIVIMYT